MFLERLVDKVEIPLEKKIRSVDRMFHYNEFVALYHGMYGFLLLLHQWHLYYKIGGLLTLNQILFLFFLYSYMGWMMECIFRSINERRPVNPGFLTGPFVPLYGFAALTGVYIFPFIGVLHIVYRLLFYFVFATAVEYVVGEVILLIFKKRLWDYRDQKFHFRGIISMKYSLCWVLVSIVFEQVIYPLSLMAMNLIGGGRFQFFNLFILGLIYIDLFYSSGLMNIVRAPLRRLMATPARVIKKHIKQGQR